MLQLHAGLAWPHQTTCASCNDQVAPACSATQPHCTAETQRCTPRLRVGHIDMTCTHTLLLLHMHLDHLVRSAMSVAGSIQLL
jgi:hypothetical protein